MRRGSGSGVYALLIIVVLIGACIFGVLMLQGAISHTDQSSVVNTSLSGVNSTVSTTLSAVFSGSMLPIWILIIAAVCFCVYMMIRASKRR